MRDDCLDDETYLSIQITELQAKYDNLLTDVEAVKLENGILQAENKQLSEKIGRLEELYKIVKDVQCNFPYWWYQEGYNELVYKIEAPKETEK